MNNSFDGPYEMKFWVSFEQAALIRKYLLFELDWSYNSDDCMSEPKENKMDSPQLKVKFFTVFRGSVGVQIVASKSHRDQMDASFDLYNTLEVDVIGANNKAHHV